jgi:hypothetical protein
LGWQQGERVSVARQMNFGLVLYVMDKRIQPIIFNHSVVTIHR